MSVKRKQSEPKAMNTGENTLRRKFNELIHSSFLKKVVTYKMAGMVQGAKSLG